MLTPRDLRESYEIAHQRAGHDPEAPASRETWQEMLRELAQREARRSTNRTAELVVSTTGADEQLDWIDDQICGSFASGCRRVKEVKEFDLHGNEPGRRYLLRSLRVPQFEADTPDTPEDAGQPHRHNG